jgi:predicted DNA-binding transcriptional regulator AlpA
MTDTDITTVSPADTDTVAIVFLPFKEVIRRAGMSRAEIYRELTDPMSAFPRPIKRTNPQMKTARLAWIESELTEWQRQQIETRRVHHHAEAVFEPYAKPAPNTAASISTREK